MARILVADDHPAILRLIERVLQMDGHDVRTAADGKQALERVGEGLPELILLDVTMPEKNGLEVLQTLKSNPATRPIPVILMTAMNWESELAAGLEVGADGFVAKPFSPAEIVSIARRSLGPG